MCVENQDLKTGITVLGSGSKGNASVIHSGESAILVDAGFSARELRKRLKSAGIPEQNIKCILISHEHSDHTKGARVLSDQLKIPVYCNRLTADVLRNREPKFGAFHIFATGSPFMVEDFLVQPFSIPHDASDPVAFTFTKNEKKIAIATDLGHVNNLTIYQLQKCHALILESNHEISLLQSSERPWSLKQRILGRHGHLNNENCMELIKTVTHECTKAIVLAHSSSDCNRYEIIEEHLEKCIASLNRPDIETYVAHQDEIVGTIWL